MSSTISSYNFNVKVAGLRYDQMSFSVLIKHLQGSIIYANSSASLTTTYVSIPNALAVALPVSPVTDIVTFDIDLESLLTTIR